MRRTLSTLAMLGITAAVVLVGISPADAAVPTCDGATCYGKDPTRTYSGIDGYRCDAGAYTPGNGQAAVSTAEGYIELRYGPHCHANWARISNAVSGAWFWVQNANGDSLQYFVPTGWTSEYGDMVNGYPLARAGGTGGHTGWY